MTRLSYSAALQRTGKSDDPELSGAALFLDYHFGCDGPSSAMAVPIVPIDVLNLSPHARKVALDGRDIAPHLAAALVPIRARQAATAPSKTSASTSIEQHATRTINASPGQLAAARAEGAAAERTRWAATITNKASAGKAVQAAAHLIAYPQMTAKDILARVGKMDLDSSLPADRPSKAEDQAHRASWQKAYRAAGVAK